MASNENRKRQARPSTDSELETSGLSDITRNNKKEKQEKKKSKKNKSINLVENENETVVEDSSSRLDITISAQLCEINQKLSTVLTKEDKTFIENIIINTIEKMKENILSSVIHRLDIVESDNLDKDITCDKLKKDLEKQKKENASLKDHIETLRREVNAKDEKHTERLNDMEQYGRRNNIRISGISHDVDKQTSEQTTKQVLDMIKHRMGVKVSTEDVDICHRLGRFKPGESRQVIVRFVKRQTKIDVMKKTVILRKSKCGVYINDDLTPLNNRVLASVRRKAPGRVLQSWSYEGKLFARYKGESTRFTTRDGAEEDTSFVRQILYKDYNSWLNLPWPEQGRSHGRTEKLSVEKHVAEGNID